VKWGRAPLQNCVKEELGEAMPCACGVVLRDSIVLPAACVRARGVVLCSVFMHAASSCVHVRVVSLCSCARGVVVFMCAWCRRAMCAWRRCAMCDLHACDGELRLGTERWGGVRGDEKKREGDDGQKGKNYTVLWLVADGRLLSSSACPLLRVRAKAS
jgi:hypothetical protein